MQAFVEKRKVDFKGLRARATDGRSSEFLWGPYEHQCPSCGAKGIPSSFTFCGCCGAGLG
jgi:naphthoate synthase